MMKTVVMYTVFCYGQQNPTGGTKRYLELINGLIDKGNIVNLFIPKQARFTSNTRLIRHDIKKYEVNTPVIPNSLLNYVSNYKILCSIRKLKYDAIISFDVPNSILFAFLRLKNLYVFIRQDFIGCRNLGIGRGNFIKDFYLAFLKKMESIVLLSAHRIVVQCFHDKNILLQRHRKIKNLIRDKIVILNNNVNSTWVTCRKYRRNERNKANGIKLAFVGGLDDPRKGLSILLDAVTMLLKEDEKLSLDVIGGGESLQVYRTQYNNMNNIKFWGWVKDPLDVINDCDLLVVPSLKDSFPNVITEAFHLELPVIGSDVGGIPEMLEYEDLIFPNNVMDLTTKLRDIIDGEKLELYREYSRKRKKDLTFDWVEKVLALI